MNTKTSQQCPPANRIRLGDVWLDPHGRRHRAEPCYTRGLVSMVPMDHKLAPVAMDVERPYPWQRIESGGR
jgi:hypothetical protein